MVFTCGSEVGVGIDVGVVLGAREPRSWWIMIEKSVRKRH